MSLRLLATIAVALVIIRVADAAIAADGNYLIEQREAANGLEVFSPYVLWNDHINEESAELQSPVAIRSVNGRLDVELTVEQFRFRSLFSFNTRAFCYDGKCSVPGPTLYCRAGDTIR